MMTHASCPACRLRFELVAYGDDRCSACHGRLTPAVASELVGYRLGSPSEVRDLARAVALSAALPDPSPDA